MSTVGQAKVVFEAETGQVSDQLVAAMEKAMAKIEAILDRMSQATEAEGRKAGDGLGKGMEDGASRAEKAVDGIDGSGLSKVEEAAAKAGAAVANEVTGGAAKADAAMDKIDGGGLSKVEEAAARAGSAVAADIIDGSGRAEAALDSIDGAGLNKVGEAAARAGQKIDSEVTAGARSADAALDAIDGAGLGTVTTAAEKAATATERVGSEAVEAGQKARAAGESGATGFRTMDGTIGSVLSKAGRLGGAFAAVAGPAAILKGGFDRLMNIQRAEIMFQAVGLSADQTKAQMARLSEQVTGTSVSLADAAKYSAMFAQSGVEMGKPMDSAIQAFTSLASIAEGSGVDVGRVLQQISANGKLTGEDLAQMADAGVNASKYLADSLGIPQEEIKKMVSDGKISFEDFVTAINEGTGDLAKQMGQTLPAKISNMKTAFSNLGATLIEPFIPAITAVVEFGIVLVKGAIAPIKAVTAWFQSGSVASQALITALKAIGVVVAAAALGWGLWAAQFILWPAIVGAATAATGAFTGVMSLLTMGLTAARTALMSLWTVLLTNPIAWVVIGITALVAGIVVLWNRSEAFRDFWTGLWDSIVGKVTGVVDTIKAAWGELTAVLRGGDDGYAALGSIIGTDAAQAVFDVLNRVRIAWDELKTAFSGGDDGYGALASLIGVDMAERIITIVGNVKNAWEELTTAFSGGDWGYGALSQIIGTDAASTVIDVVARVGDTLRGIGDLAQGVADIFFRGDYTGMPFGIEEDSPIVAVLFGMRDAAHMVWDAIKQVGLSLLDVGKSIASAGWETIKAVFGALVEVGKALWSAISQIALAVWDLIQALAPVLLPVLKVIGAIIGGVIVAAFFVLMGALKLVAGLFQVLAGVIGWLAENVLTPLIGIIGEVVGWLVEKLGGAISGVVEFITFLFQGIGATFVWIWEQLQAAWENVGKPVVDFIIATFQWWWDGIQLGFRLLGAAFEVIWTGLGMAWEAWGRPVLDFIIAAFNVWWTGVQIVFGWVRAGWDFLWNAVTAVYHNVIAPVIGWIVDRFNDLRAGVQAALDWVRLQIDRVSKVISALYDTYVQPMVDRVIRGFVRIKDTVTGWKDAVVGAVAGAGRWLVDAGRNVVQGFINGIKSLAGRIGSAFLDMVPGWIKGPFKKALGIASPSKLFAEYGRNIGEGLVAGVDDMGDQVQRSTQGLANRAADITVPTVAGPTAVAAAPVAAGPVVAAPVVTGGAAPELAADASAGISESFAGMAASLGATSTGVLDPMWMSQSAQMMGLGSTVATQTTGVIMPSWDAMAAQLAATKLGVIDPTMLGVQGAVTQTASTFLGQISAVIAPALQYLVTTLFWSLNSGVNPVFAGIRGGLQHVVSTFTWAVSAIAQQWAQVREATARPVRFTIQSVFNDGLVGMWNSVSDLLGTKKMGQYPVRFASGGILPGYTPGRDPHLFTSPTGGAIALSGGEAIMRPEVARGMGSDWVDGVNAAARMGGTKGVQSFLGSYAGGGVVPSITNLVRRFWPMMTITSTYRNTPDHHGGGRAVDFSNGRDSTPAMRSATAWFAKNYQPALLELIHSPSPFNIKNGRNVGNGFGFYGAGTMNQHRNHVHVAAARPLPSPGGALASIPGDPGMGDWDIAGAFTQEWKDKINKAVAGYKKSGGLVDAWPPAVAAKLTKAADEKIEKAFMEMGGDPGGEGVERWRPLAVQALARHGYNPAQHINAMMKQIQIESGGNPRAINNWDSNAAKGTPSGGLLQVIAPTYRSVRGLYPSAFKGLPDDMFHPLTNLTAGVGAVRRDWGGPAGRWPTTGGYHDGGVMGTGRGTFHKTAFAPERILSPRQTESFERLVDWIDRQPALPIQPVPARGTTDDYGRSTRTVLVTQNIIADDPKGAADAVEDRLIGLLT